MVFEGGKEVKEIDRKGYHQLNSMNLAEYCYIYLGYY